MSKRLESMILGLARLQRLHLPQVWDIRMLRDHYPAWSENKIRRMASIHAGYEAQRGKSFILTIHQVEMIDQAIEDGRAS